MNLIIDDLDTRVVVSGGGLPILMIHGWKDSLETFDLLAKDFEQDYKVIRLDLPGFGGSQTPPEPWGASEYADFVSKALLKLEEPELYAVVAHSMGARIMLNALGRRTVNAENFIVIAGAGIPLTKSVKKHSLFLLAKTGKVVSAVLPKTHRKKLRDRLYKATGSDYSGAGELKETFKKLVAEDSRRYAPDVHAKTLLIYSNNDKQTPPNFGEQFAKLIPNAQLVMVGDLGHNIHKEDPQKVIRLIKEFL